MGFLGSLLRKFWNWASPPLLAIWLTSLAAILSGLHVSWRLLGNAASAFALFILALPGMAAWTLRVAARGLGLLLDVLKSLFFWLLTGVVHALPLLWLITPFVMLWPFLFADSLFGIMKSTHGSASVVVDWLRRGMLFWVSGLNVAQDALPSGCISGKMFHVVDLRCWPVRSPDAIPLGRFDTIFHAVFAFCIGFGVIFEAGQVGERQIRLLEKFTKDAIAAQKSLFIEDLENPIKAIKRLNRSVRIAPYFCWFVRRCLHFAQMFAYPCFFVSAALTGFMLVTSAITEDKIVPGELVTSYYALATAPFLQGTVLVAVVLSTFIGRLLFARAPALLNRDVLREIKDDNDKAAGFTE